MKKVPAPPRIVVGRHGPEDHQMPDASPLAGAPTQPFPCDALNVQLMRLRLRQPGTESWLDEQDTLIDRVRHSGLVRLPAGVRASDELRDESLADSVMLDLIVAWQSGRLLYFSRKGLDRVVRDYLRQSYWGHGGGGDEEAPDLEDDLAADPGEEVQLARLDLPAFALALAESPRRLLDWILSNGEGYGQHGWQTRAKTDLGVSDSWVSVNHGKLLEMGRRFFEVRP
jgi:hypothetical protein